MAASKQMNVDALMDALPEDLRRLVLIWWAILERRREAARALIRVRNDWYDRRGNRFWKPDEYGPGF